MPWVKDDYGDLIWVDGSSNPAEDTGSDWSRGEATNDRSGFDDSGDDFGGFVKRATDKTTNDQDAARDVEGSSQADPAKDADRQYANLDLIQKAAKALGISEQELLKGGLGALLGGGLGYLASRRGSGMVSRGAKLAPYKPTTRVQTGAVGTGGRGGVQHFENVPYGAQPKIPYGQTPAVYGPDGRMYPSAAAARAAGEQNFTLQRPVGVTPPTTPLAGQPPAGQPPAGQPPAGLPGLQGNQQAVDQAYRSLFGRAADPTGLDFFSKGLDTGQITQQNLLENIRRGAQGADRDKLGGIPAVNTPTSQPPPSADIMRMRNQISASSNPMAPIGRGNPEALTGGRREENPLLDQFGYPQTPIGGWTYAAGGKTPTGLGYLRSAEDGMADRIPATIDDRQPAKLSGGEFVIPADVVSHLGNGNSDAGAKQLHDFMARIRKARTGNQAQGKRIDPAKFFPKGRG